MLDEYIQNEVLTRLEYATITHGMGIYKGTMEAIVCISVTGKEHEDALFEVGHAYKTQFRQESVMYSCDMREVAFKWSTTATDSLLDDISDLRGSSWPVDS